jgi:ABC-2 type transport system permease protein
MFRKYLALARAAWSITVEYRAQIVIWMMYSILMVIMLVVWLSISENGAVNGYTSADFVTYFMIGWLVRNLTAVWASWELDFAIREGRLSPMLLRPIHPIHNDLAINWVEKSLRIMIVLPVIIVVLLVTPGINLLVTPLNICAFALSVIGAWLILFFVDYLIGMLAFWTSQASAFIIAFDGIRLVLTGIIAPLAMFPHVVQDVLRWTPFPYMLNFSVDIAMGRLTAEQMLFGFGIQWVWVAVVIMAMRLVWKMAIRSYSAVGA